MKNDYGQDDTFCFCGYADEKQLAMRKIFLMANVP
jgi:hypothetical protein